MGTTTVASLTSLLLLLACAEAGLVFERVGQTAKDVAEQIDTGVRSVLHRPRDHTVVARPAVIATTPTTSHSRTTTQKLADEAAAEEEQGRSFIEASRRCPPGETLTMDECRPSLDF